MDIRESQNFMERSTFLQLCQYPLPAPCLQPAHPGKGPVLFHQPRRRPHPGRCAPRQRRNLVGVFNRPHAAGGNQHRFSLRQPGMVTSFNSKPPPKNIVKARKIKTLQTPFS